MTTRIVGRVRINEHVSPEVGKYFNQFPPFMDRIEIFDNSISNDPAPPVKAAAVLHRSALVVHDESYPCVSVLRQKVFDYNNRDFQKTQLQALVDSVSTTYLSEQGGGVQLTVHHLTASSWTDLEISAKSTEIGQHRNFLVLPSRRYFFSPFQKTDVRVELYEPTHLDPHIAGLSGPVCSYRSEEFVLHVLHIDSGRRRMHCLLEILNDNSCDRSKITAMINRVLRNHVCIDAQVLSAGFGPQERLSGGILFNRRLVNMKNAPPTTGCRLHPEFIL